MRLHEFEDYKRNITLFEVLDNPYPISHSTPFATKVADAAREIYGSKITGLHVYERTDTGSANYHRDVFIVIRHDGLWEVHHANYDNPKNPVSGITLNLSAGGNPRFIATVLKLYLSKIGKGIRVVSTPEMLKNYVSIMKRYIKRNHDQYSISSIDDNYLGVDGRVRSAVTITPNSKLDWPTITLDK